MKAYEEIAARVPMLEKITGAEVGVLCGKTSAGLLGSLPNLHLYMVDEWRVLPHAEAFKSDPEGKVGVPGQPAKALAAALGATERWAQRRTIIVEDMVRAAYLVPRNLGFAFLDADHTAQGTYQACCAWWFRVAPGGLLCGHDWGVEEHGWGVEAGVMRFVQESGAQHPELGEDLTWFIRKKEEPSCE